MADDEKLELEKKNIRLDIKAKRMDAYIKPLQLVIGTLVSIGIFFYVDVLTEREKLNLLRAQFELEQQQLKLDEINLCLQQQLVIGFSDENARLMAEVESETDGTLCLGAANLLTARVESSDARNTLVTLSSFVEQAQDTAERQGCDETAVNETQLLLTQGRDQLILLRQQQSRLQAQEITLRADALSLLQEGATDMNRMAMEQVQAVANSIAQLETQINTQTASIEAIVEELQAAQDFCQ